MAISDFATIILAGIASGVSWIFYLHALKTGPIAQVATIDRLSVISLVFLFTVLFGEVLHFKQMVGVALMVLGIYFVGG